jgi:hypothetical protein
MKPDDDSQNNTTLATKSAAETHATAKQLLLSARLYASLYDTDEETQALTTAAIVDWPHSRKMSC